MKFQANVGASTSSSDENAAEPPKTAGEDDTFRKGAEEIDSRIAKDEFIAAKTDDPEDDTPIESGVEGVEAKLVFSYFWTGAPCLLSISYILTLFRKKDLDLAAEEEGGAKNSMYLNLVS